MGPYDALFNYAIGAQVQGTPYSVQQAAQNALIQGYSSGHQGSCTVGSIVTMHQAAKEQELLLLLTEEQKEEQP